MTAKEAAKNPIAIREFTAAKQISFFEALKGPRFSGQLVLTDPRGQKWAFYLFLGRILYATGGTHPVRRWKRNLMAFLPQIPSNLETLEEYLTKIEPEAASNCWEYQLLGLWVEQQKITLEQAGRLIRSTIVEVFFDVTQAAQLTCELKPQNQTPSPKLVLIDAEQAISEAKQNWQKWQAAKIADRSPNLAPVITEAGQLQQTTSEQLYRTLSQLLDGQQTLRDLAVRMKRDVLTVTSSLLPYIQQGLIRLTEVADFPSLLASPPSEKESQSGTRKELIACIDDSPLICQSMQQLVTSAGYQFLSINNPLRAVATLLARKPDLIFLDLVMPNANGYEICTQLRKLSVFRNTPIIILTGNDGIIDRVRAKMIGSTDFIGKPVKAEVVLQTIQKHLKDSPQPNQD